MVMMMLAFMKLIMMRMIDDNDDAGDDHDIIGTSEIQKFGNWEIQKFSNSEIRKIENSKVRKFENSDIRKFGISKVRKYRNGENDDCSSEHRCWTVLTMQPFGGVGRNRPFGCRVTALQNCLPGEQSLCSETTGSAATPETAREGLQVSNDEKRRHWDSRNNPCFQDPSWEALTLHPFGGGVDENSRLAAE